jgi:hypothetical protein
MNLPKKRGLYAWNFLHAGSFLLFVKDNENNYEFLFLPGPTQFFLTKEDFNQAIEKNILEFVEDLPKEIFEETINFALTCPT